MVQKIKRIIFDPVKARVLYDLFVVAFCFALIYGLLSLFVPQVPHPAEFAYPIFAILLSFILGIYTRYRISNLFLKFEILSISTFGSFLLISFIADMFSAPLLLSSVFSLILLFLPRLFLNFHILASGNIPLNTVVQSHSPILVVGGGGYIGSYVVENLLSKGYAVKVFDKFLYGRNVLKDLEKNPKLEIIEGDISNIFQLTLALQNTQAVVHLAGIVGDPASALDPTVTRHMNITSTRILKDTAKAFGIPRFIFASSCSVYGANDEVVNESSVTNPLSLYAQSKIDSENEILRETADFFHPTVLRFATVFGHSRRPRFDLVANLFAAKAFAKEDITVFNGEQWRPLIHVKDVAEAIVLCLQAPLEKVSREIFNVGDDQMNYTILNIAQTAQDISGKNRIRIIEENAVQDKRNYRVSFEKINKILGFEAKITLFEGMREMYENFLNKTYIKDYKNPLYSNLEMTKSIKMEFYSEDYKKSHITDFEVINPKYSVS